MHRLPHIRSSNAEGDIIANKESSQESYGTSMYEYSSIDDNNMCWKYALALLKRTPM